ncbi:MAG: glycoside hydrolase family 25 protein [Butyrivibrio sp.]|nr:glycoside hydrolase family 25 protein [Butyrivibrio sp.]
MLFMSRRKNADSEENEHAFEVEEVEDLAEKEDSAGVETSEEPKDTDPEENDNSGEAGSTADMATKEDASERKSSEQVEKASGEDADPEAQVAKNTGAEVDVAKLLSASNVGENSSVTYGIDVSKFQGTIDWQQVASTGIDFAMVRVGYRDSSTGEIKADTNAKYNMQEAEKNGIKIGAYFFSTAVSSEEAVEEASWVASYISKYPITYPVGFNCEGFDNESSRQYNLSKDERSAIALAFLDQIYSAGYTPIFYASRGELSGDSKWNTSQIQQKCKIWMAWYDQDVSNLAGGPDYEGQCAMWQYSSKGTVAGIGKSVDVDVAYFGYNGTESAKDTSERETATADVEALMKFSSVEENVTAKNTTNLRDKPSQGSESTVKLALQNGQVALRTGISDSGWSRVVYEGNTYYAVSSFLTTDISAPKQEEPKVAEDNSGFKTKFTDCNEVVTAKDVVNLRSKPSVTDEDSVVVASLSSGDTAVRTGINQEYGWSRVEYNGQTLYCVSSYLRVVE